METLIGLLEFCHGCQGRQDFEEATLFICKKLNAVALRDLNQGDGWIILTDSRAGLWMETVFGELRKYS